MYISAEVTPFTKYELTEEEYVRGCVFSTEQLAVLQNEIVILAMKKVELVVDPNYPAEAAEIDGQLSILRFIIDRSNAQAAKLADASLLSVQVGNHSLDTDSDFTSSDDDTILSNALDL